MFGGLVVLVWVAYFRRLDEFGLTGDDVSFIGFTLNRTWEEQLAHVQYCLTRWPQGRPLGMGLNLSLFPYIVSQFGGLAALHVVAGLILATNGFLLWRIVSERAPPLVAFAGAGFFVLAPAPTVQLQLVFSYNFQLAILCALLGTLFALRGRWILFSVAVAASLLMVEPAAVAALVLGTLLGLRPNRAGIRNAALLALAWVLIAGATLVARKAIGDPWGNERVGEMLADPIETAQRASVSAFTGTHTHFRLTGERLLQPLRELDLEIALSAIAVVIATTVAVVAGTRVSRACTEASTDPSPVHGTPPPRAGAILGPPLWLLGVGTLVMLGSYASYFRRPWFPANWTAGFMSGVHVVATVGSCLVAAALCWFLVISLRGRFQTALAIVAGIPLGLLAGFGVLVQRDYAAAWRFQQQFWQAYDSLCPDAGERTHILVLDRNLPEFRFVERSSWTTEVLPRGLYDFRKAPASARIVQTPAVIFTAADPADAIRRDGDRYAWKKTNYFMLPKGPDQQPQSFNIIFLEHVDGRWLRLAGPVAVDGGSLAVKAPPETAPSRPPRQPLARFYGLPSDPPPAS